MKWEAIEGDIRRAELARAMVSYALDMPMDDARDFRRGSRLSVLARQAAIYLCHVACGMSLGNVAQAFRRDRSTVSHACHAVEDRRDDPLFDAWIEAMTQSLRLAPGMMDGNRGGAR